MKSRATDYFNRPRSEVRALFNQNSKEKIRWPAGRNDWVLFDEGYSLEFRLCKKSEEKIRDATKRNAQKTSELMIKRVNRARATHRYVANNEHELSFEVNQEFFDIIPAEDEALFYAKIEIEGEVKGGFVQSNYLWFKNPKKIEICARAIFQYIAKEDDELSFEVGQEFFDVKQSGVGWLIAKMEIEGEIQSGYVDDDFVEFIP